MSNAQSGAILVLSLASVWLVIFGVNITNPRIAIAFYLAAAICAAPAVIALFVTAVAG